LKARKPIAISGDRFGQNLQGNGTLQIRVRRAIHLTHAAGAK
jgi:hypothetical protein